MGLEGRGRRVAGQEQAADGVAVAGRNVSASGSQAKVASGSRITSARVTAALTMAGK